MNNKHADNNTFLTEKEIKQEKFHKQKAGIEIAQLKADVTELMKTGHGRRFVMVVLNLTGMNSDSIHFGEETHNTSYAMGKRQVGISVSNIIQANAPTDLYLKMLKEQQEKEKRNV